MSNYVKELEQFYKAEKLRQLPKKCHKCECTEMTWDLKGNPVWRCMYIECIMEEEELVKKLRVFEDDINNYFKEEVNDDEPLRIGDKEEVK